MENRVSIAGTTDTRLFLRRVLIVEIGMDLVRRQAVALVAFNNVTAAPQLLPSQLS
jgi:hypothetical protein